ncbi:aldehyde dehydrogenase family protein [Rhodospirillum centenum]|uniref:Aldehyde dehydrogenase, putative n=1 Tax=Rhodospirillum centenum (strain ATCC 51521 / SW) TaxID=414684 RepID=B6IXT6_RHOCS|nr:aldehyde dehydrogenase family protein [Rhodospirillum centenum]ACJ01110.1 aldehyde dehydrogenase, putative [Rhodospirillum centenum SW]
MSSVEHPELVPNWYAGAARPPSSDRWGDKLAPHDGRLLSRFALSAADDVDAAVAAAAAAQPAWAALTPVRRGEILREVVAALRAARDGLADLVALETGKPPKDARGETAGALLQGDFWAGEGLRLYGRTLSSAMPGRYSGTVRQPIGIAGLIVPANTPIANIAWKVFPALLCGNAAVLKASEDAPLLALRIARIAEAAGLPPGVLNVVQGLGAEAGAALVGHPDVGVVSFTGSTAVGRWIAEAAGRRLARVSLELGGKNAFVVCDDADLDKAVHWAVLSAFSNAGQRCAAGSRLIVMDRVYEAFRDRFVERARSLRLGVTDADDLGPVINARQLATMLARLDDARQAGARVLTGGHRLTGPGHATGCYLAPTVLEGLDPGHPLSDCELFGPITALYRVADFQGALDLANRTAYGLTAAIHTRSLDRALTFCQRVRAGVANANIGTFGSEPQMPFGGFGLSGNGSREPGTEALDVYSELKTISLTVDQDRL